MLERGLEYLITNDRPEIWTWTPCTATSPSRPGRVVNELIMRDVDGNVFAADLRDRIVGID